MNVSLNRRNFTKGLGGIVLAFTLDPAAAQPQPRALPGSLGGNRMLDAWIRINADGTATVFTGKVELGQGILTALWQIVVLLVSGRVAGELMQRLGQPPIIGQIIAGVLLGPSVLGALAPQLHQLLFPAAPAQKAMLDAVAQLGVLKAIRLPEDE